MSADIKSVTTKDCRQLECRVAAVMAYCDLGCILIATFSSCIEQSAIPF